MSIKVWGFFFLSFLFNNICFAYDIKLYPIEHSLEYKPTLDLVFSGLNYQNQKVFFNDIEIFIQRLKQTRPFTENFGRIKFYCIYFSEKEKNVIFQQVQGFPPLKVRQDFLEDIFARLKSNYKLVIIDASGLTSCAELSSSEKASLIILGKARYKDKHSFAKGFLHELGHSLGLRDECVDCQQLLAAGPPNCAAIREDAEKWWGDLVGKDLRVNYISGCCGNKDYIRPTIASFMNDPGKAEDFGPVNERYLNELLKNKIVSNPSGS
ncbi:MAG: hypothetical protein MUC39_01010 [Candidatus Omnitrophica bacterium]|jgi:hypothetical protein|nr:hypothetical protein [Candidatus Omnitrophota bacterium]